MQIYVPKLIKQKKFSVFPGFLTKTTKKEPIRTPSCKTGRGKSPFGGQTARRFGDHAAAVRITSMPARPEQKRPPQKFCGGFVQNGNGPVYFVTRSSHLTMASMANIEMAQTMTKMLHVAEIEMRL